MSTVFIASIGIFIPFCFFVVALFLYLHTLWIENATTTGNADDYTNTKLSSQQPYDAVENPSAEFAFNAARSIPSSAYAADVSRRPIFTTASRPGYLSNRGL